MNEIKQRGTSTTSTGLVLTVSGAWLASLILYALKAYRNWLPADDAESGRPEKIERRHGLPPAQMRAVKPVDGPARGGHVAVTCPDIQSVVDVLAELSPETPVHLAGYPQFAGYNDAVSLSQKLRGQLAAAKKLAGDNGWEARGVCVLVPAADLQALLGHAADNTQ